LTNKYSIEDKINGYQAGCDAYLPKPFEPSELTAIVKHLLARSQIIQAELLYTEIEHQSPSPLINFNYNSSDNLPHNNLHLTNREKEVLKFLTQGLSNIKIAEELYLSPKTIEKYVGNLLRKTNSNNRTELASFALKNSII
jgi:DNA-binding NarL/FixJ family response regulator